MMQAQVAPPSARDRRHTTQRARILRAARVLLDQRGHERTSLRAIARATNFSPASLYEYFDGKEAIFEALSLQAGAELRASLDKATTGGGMAADVLVRLGLAYVRHAADNQEDFLLLFSRSMGSVPALDGGPDSALWPLVEAADCGLTSGEFDPLFIAEELAWGVWALAHGMATLRLTGPPLTTLDGAVDDAYALRAHVAGLAI